jgi:hypothetical protein
MKHSNILRDYNLYLTSTKGMVIFQKNTQLNLRTLDQITLALPSSSPYNYEERNKEKSSVLTMKNEAGNHSSHCLLLQPQWLGFSHGSE